MVEHSEISRRDVLRGITAGAVGTTGLAGVVSASTGRHIVGANTDAAVRAAQSRADSVYRTIDLGSYRTLVAGVFAPDARDDLANRPDVEYLQRDRLLEVIHHDDDHDGGPPGDDDGEEGSSQTLPWGIDRIDADVAHANGETGDGADLAIIDTGIDSDHPDLQANIGEGKAFTECRGNPRQCQEPWDDDHDHGTHVSGTADALDNDEGVVGVSTQAILHALKVCDKSGFCATSDIADAVRYAADQGWDVANLSLGSSSESPALKDAGEYAYNEGLLLVAAAGNDGPCTDCVSYPAAYNEYIAVSATSIDDTLASFSSTGPEVDLAAPGEDVCSTVIGGYDVFSGTSMATPHVAGSGAQLMANGDSNDQARSTLQNSAEDLGLSSNKQGDGLVDTAEALGLDSSDDGTGDGTDCP